MNAGHYMHAAKLFHLLGTRQQVEDCVLTQTRNESGADELIAFVLRTHEELTRAIDAHCAYDRWKTAAAAACIEQPPV